MDQSVPREFLRDELLRLQKLISDSEYCHDALVESRTKRALAACAAVTVLTDAHREIARAHKLAAVVEQLLHPSLRYGVGPADSPTGENL